MDGLIQHVDSNASGSRFRFTGSGELDNGLTAGVNLEYSLGATVRHANVYIASEGGTLTIGHTGHAADGASNARLGGPSWLGGVTNWCSYASGDGLGMPHARRGSRSDLEVRHTRYRSAESPSQSPTTNTGTPRPRLPAPSGTVAMTSVSATSETTEAIRTSSLRPAQSSSRRERPLLPLGARTMTPAPKASTSSSITAMAPAASALPTGRVKKMASTARPGPLVSDTASETVRRHTPATASSKGMTSTTSTRSSPGCA